MNQNSKKLIIVSGLSGSGKSITLDTLEDYGYYCIDNLPVELIESFIIQLAKPDHNLYEKAAISIDPRNQNINQTQFSNILSQAKELGIRCEILYLQADSETLLKRFSETRRKHPLTGVEHPLAEAMRLEKSILEPLASRADLVVDTTATNVHQLRELIRGHIGNKVTHGLSLFFQSFGFKHGAPLDADFVFDVRCLPNPHWEPSLRSLTGQDKPVADFLANNPSVHPFLDDITGFLHRWIPLFETENRSYLTVAIGCTGGQHRSVYLVEQLSKQFKKTRNNVLVRHRELD
jgi:UPF0042 nucleotide-binding protein